MIRMEFHEKAHKFHAVTSIVQDYCIECLLKSLSTSSGEAVWQKKSLLGQFNNICQHHPAEADEFFTSQKPSWKRDFTFYALDHCSSSRCSVLTKEILTLTSHIATLKHSGYSFRESIWSWISLNGTRNDSGLIIQLIVALLESIELNSALQHSDVIVNAIVRELQTNDNVCSAVRCWQALTRRHQTNSTQSQILINLSLQTLTRFNSTKKDLTQLLVAALKAHLPQSTVWLRQISNLNFLLKSLLNYDDVQVTRGVCDLIRVLVGADEEWEQFNMLSQTDIFDVLCERLMTQDYSCLIAIVEVIHMMCKGLRQSRGNVLQLQHGLDNLLRHCNNAVNMKAGNVMAMVLQSVQATMNCFNDIESEMSSKAVSLIFTLVPQVFERFDMMERPVVLSIELVSVIIKSCSLSPEQIQQQTVIIHKLGEMLPILSVQYTSANADFLSFLEHTLKLCRLVIKFSRIHRSTKIPNQPCMPAQLDELISAVLSHLDQEVMAVLEDVLQEPLNADIPIAFFELIGEIVDLPGSSIQCFVQKFLCAGGVQLGISMKAWDSNPDKRPINQCLAKLINYAHSDEVFLHVTTTEVSLIPEELVGMVHGVLQAKELSVAKCIISTLSSVIKTMKCPEGRIATAAAVQKHCWSSYNRMTIRALGSHHITALARVLASTWYELKLETEGKEQACKDSVLAPAFQSTKSQGLPLYVIDCIERANQHGSTLPADLHLLAWISAMTESESPLCKTLLIECGECYSSTLDKQLLMAILAGDPLLLDLLLSLSLTDYTRLEHTADITEGVLNLAKSSRNCNGQAVCNVLEHRLSQLCVDHINQNSRSTGAINSDILSLIKILTGVLQSRRKQYMDLSVVMLANQVTQLLNVSGLSKQTCVAITDYLITVLQSTLSTREQTAVRTLLEDSAVHTYIDTCLSSDDPYWRLSVIGLLTAMFKCARRFHLQISNSYKLPVNIFLAGVGDKSPIVRLAYLQLWYAEILSEMDALSSIISFARTDEKSKSLGLTDTERRVVIFHLQQDLISDISLIRSNAAIVMTTLLESKQKTCSGEVRLLPWDRVLRDHVMTMNVQDQHCSPSNRMEDVVKALEKCEDGQSPYISYGGVTVLALTVP